MYSLPQEIEVWYLIPAIRRELSKILTEKYGLTLEKTGDMLGVTKAAVSQYLHKKRASGIKLSDNIKKEIGKSAKILAGDKTKALSEMLKILDLMKKEGCACAACKKYNKGIIEQCKMNLKMERSI